MDFARLPRYPIHDEPLPSQVERLFQADRADRWSLIVLIVIPVTLIFMILAIHLVLHSAGRSRTTSTPIGRMLIRTMTVTFERVLKGK
jgi:hypothetical protein